jgi:ATPase family protein associated with various cellular activities (AAA)
VVIFQTFSGHVGGHKKVRNKKMSDLEHLAIHRDITLHDHHVRIKGLSSFEDACSQIYASPSLIATVVERNKITYLVLGDHYATCELEPDVHSVSECGIQYFISLDIIISPALAERTSCSIGDEVILRVLDVNQITSARCILVESVTPSYDEASRADLEYIGRKEARIYSNPALRTFETAYMHCLDSDHDLFRITQKTRRFGLNPSAKLSCMRPFDLFSIITKLEKTRDMEGWREEDVCSVRTYEKILRRVHKFQADAQAKKSLTGTASQGSIQIFKSSLAWSDIAGQHDVKNRLLECFNIGEKLTKQYHFLGIKAPRGILLYGPPGCSKTLLAKAASAQTGRAFIAVKGPEVFSKWVGDSEKRVHEIFEAARGASPAIIFFDEIDSIGSTRSSSGTASVSDRVLSQLLMELDGISASECDVVVLAATNRPDVLVCASSL